MNRWIDGVGMLSTVWRPFSMSISLSVDATVDETWRRLQTLARPKEWLFGSWQIGRNRDIWLHFDDGARTFQMSPGMTDSRNRRELRCELAPTEAGTRIDGTYGYSREARWQQGVLAVIAIGFGLMVLLASVSTSPDVSGIAFSLIWIASCVAVFLVVRRRNPALFEREVAQLLPHIIDVTGARPIDPTTRRLALQHIDPALMSDESVPERKRQRRPTRSR